MPECVPDLPESLLESASVYSSKSSIVQTQEVAQIKQIADTDDLPPLIDSANLSNSNTSAVIAKILTPKQCINFNNIGK